MKTMIRTAIAGGLLASSFSVLAQHEGHTGGPQADTGACLAHAKESLRIVETSSLRLEEARQTNSPQRMRAAVDDLQAALAEVRTQLSFCVGRATTPAAGDASGMEGMDHSKMEDMDHSKMQHEKAPAPSNTPTPRPKPHGSST
jgi:uncharacterized protein involved in copper resistance